MHETISAIKLVQTLNTGESCLRHEAATYSNVLCTYGAEEGAIRGSVGGNGD